MVNIAVAGGSGHVGRTIVETLVESKRHDVIVLARKENAENQAVYIVDYAEVEATARILKQCNVHTVICAIQVADEAASTAQLNLIKAAALAPCVQRFIISAWGAFPSEKSPVAIFQSAAETELRKTKLEWTRFAVGFFVDYYGMPFIKTQIPPMTFAVDIKNRLAAIPGTGEEPISFTYTYDVATFLDAFLDEPKWEELTYCYGEKLTWNKFISIAEEVTGCPFKVTYDAAERLAAGVLTELPSHKEEISRSPLPELLARQLYAVLGLWAVGGQFDVPKAGSLNERFPEIKPITLRDVLLLRRDNEMSQ